MTCPSSCPPQPWGVLPKSISASDVGQTFLSAGSGDFPVPGFHVKLSALVREVGKLRNRQARRPALQFGQHAPRLRRDKFGKQRLIHLPSIFAPTKMTKAPKRPPPPRRYIKEYPAAANMGVIKSAIIGFFVYRLLIGLRWSCGQVISAAGVVSLITGEWH